MNVELKKQIEKLKKLNTSLIEDIKLLVIPPNEIDANRAFIKIKWKKYFKKLNKKNKDG